MSPLAFEEKQVKIDFRMEFPFQLFKYNEVGCLNYSYHIWTLAVQKRTLCSGVNYLNMHVTFEVECAGMISDRTWNIDC